MKKILYIAFIAMFLVGCNEKDDNNPSIDKQNQTSTNDSGDGSGDDSGDGSGDDSSDSAIQGVFSVSKNKQVIFSPGNLHYTRSTNTWSFASAQYQVLGTSNVIGGSAFTDPDLGHYKYGEDLADKIDLFGWSGSTGSAKFGVSIADGGGDYSGSFVDWGTNQIGTDAPNTWRTLTTDEWTYLCCMRHNASSLFGVASINGVNGLIFLPDNWKCPEGITFKPDVHDTYGMTYYAAHQIFTAEQWLKMEETGAIFLPAAGSRYGTDIGGVQNTGDYWSATEFNSVYAMHFGFVSFGVVNAGSTFRECGLSVRLVKDL